MRLLIGSDLGQNKKTSIEHVAIEINNLPNASSQADLRIQKIPANIDILNEPIEVLKRNIPVSDERIKFDLPAINQDEVFIVTIQLGV